MGLASLAFLAAVFQPFAGSGGARVRATIPKQAGVGEIADALAAKDVITSTALFEVRATLSGHRDDLKPGTYYLRKDMQYGDLLDRLSTGPGQEFIQVTIPEGLSRREIAPVVGRAGVRGNYLQATEDPSVAPRRYAGPSRLQSTEGYLFPATYELRRGDDARTLAAKQLAAFGENMGTIDLSYARTKNLTAYDVVKIASMVEREAQLDRERPLVAAVIYNRLKAGQPLGIDATLRYATRNWSRPLTKSELALDSPFNSRTRQGLPPTPIGNPGLSSLRAAARPAKAGYLFYVVKPGACGEHAFSTTFEQFQKDQQRYNAARNAAGGNSPTTCPTP